MGSKQFWKGEEKRKVTKAKGKSENGEPWLESESILREGKEKETNWKKEEDLPGRERLIFPLPLLRPQRLATTPYCWVPLAT